MPRLRRSSFATVLPLFEHAKRQRLFYGRSDMTLAHDVFSVIAKRFSEKAREIAWMTETENSFEEWCGWEAWIACTENPAWDVIAKPQYSRFGKTGTKAGDLLVDDRNGNQLLVELGIIHDGTGPKWSDKCDADRQKLLQVAGSVSGLHLILATSLRHDDIAAANEWLERWSRLTCWSIATPFTYSVGLPEKGQMLLKGWAIEDPVSHGCRPAIVSDNVLDS